MAYVHRAEGRWPYYGVQSQDRKAPVQWNPSIIVTISHRASAIKTRTEVSDWAFVQGQNFGAADAYMESFGIHAKLMLDHALELEILDGLAKFPQVQG